MQFNRERWITRMKLRAKPEKKLNWLRHPLAMYLGGGITSLFGLEAAARFLSTSDALGVPCSVTVTGPEHFVLRVGPDADPMASEWARVAVWELVPATWTVEIRQEKRIEVPALPRRVV